MEKEEKYKVVRVYKKSQRRVTIEKNLSLEAAKSIVQSFPDSPNSMVVFTKQ